ncbi:hypothetical protein J2S19_001012 [Metabacillus malikii]|uniref:Uncharacterized protein n=1 Tax=Metabacillus malikii TaxID=1504265 RepID=A0ABT9ZER8_9BACI|nr:hypothetical protein [Metabacillus malikii]
MVFIKGMKPKPRKPRNRNGLHKGDEAEMRKTLSRNGIIINSMKKLLSSRSTNQTLLPPAQVITATPTSINIRVPHLNKPIPTV